MTYPRRTPPPHRKPLADRAVSTERKPQMLADKAAWLARIESKLNADERAYLRSRVATMTPDQIERVAKLDPDDAAFHLRCEMPRALTTRKEP